MTENTVSKKWVYHVPQFTGDRPKDWVESPNVQIYDDQRDRWITCYPQWSMGAVYRFEPVERVDEVQQILSLIKEQMDSCAEMSKRERESLKNRAEYYAQHNILSVVYAKISAGKHRNNNK